MCFRDKCNMPVVVGDTVEYKSRKYLVGSIRAYPMATVVLAEDIKTHAVETLLLHDIKKLCQ